MFGLKTAIGFFGIHYTENLNHWMGWNSHIDYSKSIENNKTFVLDNFNIVDYYSSTYFSSKIDQLIKDFPFKSLKLNTLINERGVNLISKNKRFKETIELILETNIEYEIVVLMRYDMIFLQNIKDLSINNEKVNVLCKNKCGNIHDLADDSFYIISYNKLSEFYETINKLDINRSSHEYNRHVDMHYMIDKAFYTHEYPIYTVNRLPLN